MSSAGAATSTGGASGGAPAILVAEADPNEVCVPDPLANRWISETLSVAQSSQVYRVGAGGELTLLVLQRNGVLEVSRYTAGGWLDATPIPGTAGAYPLRVDVSPDGSLALVLWSRDDTTLLSAFVDGAFRDPLAFPFPRSVDVAMFTGARALFGFADGQGINPIEYTPQAGLTRRASVLSNYNGLSATGPSSAAFFSRNSLVAGPDGLLPYVFGSGVDARQDLPARVAMQSVQQSFYFGFPNGRAMRVVRQWHDPVSDGLWATTRQADGWSAETRVTPEGSNDIYAPLVADAGANLLMAWRGETRAFVREHDGAAWLEATNLNRSRALQPEMLLRGESSALLIGQQSISAEKVSARKLYRRGADGTWYCAKLLPNALGFQATTSGNRFFVAQLVREQLELSSFEP
ncbi:MAG: hypothetical protein QM756_36335 [Polyangiaceae bacterium]